jgi:hypothetical protein
MHPLLQFIVFFIGESNEKGVHLDEHKKDHHVNLDNSIWAYPT